MNNDEQLYARNHTQRVSQTNVAREAVEQDLDPEHVEAMKRYYEANNNDELVEIMGDDDSLFEAHTEDGKVLEGKEALMQNVNKIHDENLTMNFEDGLDDLSDMEREFEYTLPDGKHVNVGLAKGDYKTAYVDGDYVDDSDLTIASAGNAQVEDPEHNANTAGNPVMDAEQLYARNHTQRVSQTNVAREAVEQDLDPEHVEAMKRYYEADNNDELVEIMGDDDSLFEAHTEDGKVLEGKEALLQNVNKIHDENLTMNFEDGLDDLSDMEQNQGPEQC